MSYHSVKGGKLVFKGGDDILTSKILKKKKHRDTHLPKTAKAEDDELSTNDLVWLPCESLEDCMGPVFFLFGDRERCIFSHENGSISLTSATSEPSNVNQVFVLKRILSGSFAIRNHLGFYLSSDSHGVITADREAIGSTEEWQIICREDGFAFQNFYDKYLCIDNTGKVLASANDISYNSIFSLRCQAALRRERINKEREQTIDPMARLSAPDLERELIKKHQHGKVLSKSESKLKDVGYLEVAKHEGRLHEELLNRRSKIKSDKFCK